MRIGNASGTDRGLWRERFLREAEAAARLKHEYIVAVYAGGVQGEGDATTGWLAMEWVHGTDMSRYACASRMLPEGVVVGICQRVALALDLAHRAGIVHRDIKPSNILFDPTTGTVKVTDFGSARVADTAATRSGVMLGTPAYMAPEQLAGADATPQCDLYALGVLLFELLIGRRPFEADSMGDLLARIAHQAAAARAHAAAGTAPAAGRHRRPPAGQGARPAPGKRAPGRARTAPGAPAVRRRRARQRGRGMARHGARTRSPARPDGNPLIPRHNRQLTRANPLLRRLLPSS